MLAGGLRLERRRRLAARASAPRTASARAAGGAVQLRAVDAAEDAGRTARRRRPPRAARRSTLEALGELRDPGELVRDGRDHGPAQPLQPALEVEQGAVALERARRGQHEVGPADGEPVEHRDRDHVLGALGERADGRVGRGLVARDDRAGRSARGSPRPRRRPRPRLRRRRGRSALPAGGTRRCRACPRSRVRARPRRGVRRRRLRCPTRRGSPARSRGAGSPSALPGSLRARNAAAAPPGPVGTVPVGP